jgi:AcrR family transcriptional regulator
MRIVKEAAERKNEILDAAEELFAARGYEATSTGDILDRVGIARGTLYYHFRSKEEILDALTERINDSLIAGAKRIAGDKSIPVMERIILAIAGMNLEDGDSRIGREVLEQVHKPQNALMHQKMQQRMLDGVVPVISALVEEGNAEGVFHAEYPRETTEMLILYAGTAFDSRLEPTPEQLQARAQALIRNTEKLLGVEAGSLAGPMARLFQQLK